MPTGGQTPSQPDYYSIIAKRIVSDPEFVIKLIKDPQPALKEALETAGLHPTAALINELSAMLEQFKTTVGYEYITRNSRDYLADRPEIEMV